MKNKRKTFNQFILEATKGTVQQQKTPNFDPGLDELKNTLISLGYDNIKPGKTKISLIIIADKKEDRKSLLNGIVDSIDGAKFVTNSSLSRQGIVKVGKYSIYSKAEIGNVNSLDARVFSAEGKNSTFSFHESNNIKCKVFTSASQIERSIIRGCKENNILKETPASDLFQELFNGNVINWSDTSTPKSVVNKLGVYVGELLIDWAILGGKTSLIEGYVAPSNTPAKSFYLPTDPSFSGVDSFIEYADGTKLGLSSKFGKGAKASMFTNLIPVTIKNINKQPKNTSFTKFCQFIIRNNLPVKAKDVVWTFGTRELLGIPSGMIKDPIKVQEDIKRNRMTKEREILEKRALEAFSLASNESDAFSNSLSVIFSKRIAEQFNNDSLDQINNILQGKQYYQISLNTAMWSKGMIHFSMKKAGSGQLKIYGDKAAVTDITAKQGWLNYEIK